MVDNYGINRFGGGDAGDAGGDFKIGNSQVFGGLKKLFGGPEIRTAAANLGLINSRIAEMFKTISGGKNSTTVLKDLGGILKKHFSGPQSKETVKTVGSVNSKFVEIFKTIIGGKHSVVVIKDLGTVINDQFGGPESKETVKTVGSVNSKFVEIFKTISGGKSSIEILKGLGGLFNTDFSGSESKETIKNFGLANSELAEMFKTISSGENSLTALKEMRDLFKQLGETKELPDFQKLIDVKKFDARQMQVLLKATGDLTDNMETLFNDFSNTGKVSDALAISLSTASEKVKDLGDAQLTDLAKQFNQSEIALSNLIDSLSNVDSSEHAKELGLFKDALSDTGQLTKLTGDQLRGLADKFGVLTFATKKQIAEFEKYDYASKDLQITLKDISAKVHGASKERLNEVLGGLKATKTSSLALFGELASTSVAAAAAVYTVFKPMIDAATEEETQVNQLRKSTDSLGVGTEALSSFLSETSTMSIALGKDLTSLRELTVDVASDLSLPYTVTGAGLKATYGTMSPIMKEYLTTASKLEKVADVSESSLRDLYKSFKAVTGGTEGSGEMIKKFGNTLAFLRAQNKLSKEDTEKFAKDTSEAIRGIGFAYGWTDKEIDTYQTTTANFLAGMAEQFGGAGKKSAEFLLENMSDPDNQMKMMNALGMSPSDIQDAVKKGDFTGVAKVYSGRMDDVYKSIEGMRDEKGNVDMFNVKQMLESSFGEAAGSKESIAGFTEIFAKMKKTGKSFAETQDKMDLTKPIASMDNKFNDIIYTFSEIKKSLGGVIDFLYRAFGAPLIKTLALVLTPVKWLLILLSKFVMALPGPIRGVLGLVIGLKVFSILLGVVTKGLVALGIPMKGLAFASIIGGIKNLGIALKAFLISNPWVLALAVALLALNEVLKAIFGENYLVEWFEATWDYLSNINLGKLLYDVIVFPFKMMWKAIVWIFTGDSLIWKAIKAISGFLLDMLLYPFRLVGKIAASIFGGDSLIGKAISALGGFILSVLLYPFKLIGMALVSLFSGGAVWKAISAIGGFLLSIFTTPINLIRKALDNIFTSDGIVWKAISAIGGFLLSIFTTPINLIGKLMSNIFTSDGIVWKAISSIGSFLLGIFTNPIKLIGDKFSNLFSGDTGIWKGVKTIGKYFIDLFLSPFRLIGKSLGWIIGKIKKFLGYFGLSEDEDKDKDKKEGPAGLTATLSDLWDGFKDLLFGNRSTEKPELPTTGYLPGEAFSLMSASPKGPPPTFTSSLDKLGGPLSNVSYLGPMGSSLDKLSNIVNPLPPPRLSDYQYQTNPVLPKEEPSFVSTVMSGISKKLGLEPKPPSDILPEFSKVFSEFKLGQVPTAPVERTLGSQVLTSPVTQLQTTTPTTGLDKLGGPISKVSYLDTGSGINKLPDTLTPIPPRLSDYQFQTNPVLPKEEPSFLSTMMSGISKLFGSEPKPSSDILPEFGKLLSGIRPETQYYNQGTQLGPVPGISTEGILGIQTGKPTLPTVSPITSNYNPEVSSLPITQVASGDTEYSPPIAAVPPSSTSINLAKIERLLTRIAGNTEESQDGKSINAWTPRKSTESEYQALALSQGLKEQIVGG